MITATTTGYRVALEPRPLRIEKVELEMAVPNFRKGKRLLQKLKEDIESHLGPLATVHYAVIPATSVPSVGSVIPPEVDRVLMIIQLVCLGICVSFAIVMAMVAGFFRILGLREEAKRRYWDAVMGMIQVLTAPVVLGLIATIVRGVLRLFPGYIG